MVAHEGGASTVSVSAEVCLEMINSSAVLERISDGLKSRIEHVEHKSQMHDGY